MVRTGVSVLAAAMCLASAAEAETWSCAYKHGSEIKSAVWQRVSGGFQDPTYENASVEIIVREDNDVIHLYSSNRGFRTYFAVVLDKQNSQFVMVGIEPFESTAIIEGNCKVFR